MKDSKQLLNRAEREIARSQKTSMTAAGPAEADSDKRSKGPMAADYIDAINQVFALFRINYHNQYHAAFGDTQLLTQAKKLWAETLLDFSPEIILRGAKKAIEQSDYLPTLHKMIGYCQGSPELHGLPDIHSAYLEACRAPSPKAEYRWSHPAVYHAGKLSDWFFLANNAERDTFPVFKGHYLDLCGRVLRGEELPPPDVKKLEQAPQTPLSKEENLKRLAELRQQLQL
ncbi:hypothetical protein G8764_20255 [Pseudomaricurvus alcaniphilus]|nr:hypothetical protein [Pseudomaricurvus alcaniphilus]